jgi:hypothetical protein
MTSVGDEFRHQADKTVTSFLHNPEVDTHVRWRRLAAWLVRKTMETGHDP